MKHMLRRYLAGSNVHPVITRRDAAEAAAELTRLTEGWDDPAPRCTATTSRGTPCTQTPQPGTDTCIFHKAKVQP